jgi:hypothetical protein
MTLKKKPKKVIKKREVKTPFKNYPEWSESKFFGFIRSALRSKMSRWMPKIAAKMKARRPYNGSNKQQKWEYFCVSCEGWFPDKEVEMNHIIEAGSLRSFDDLPEFVERLFCNEDGFECLCKPCHKRLTQEQREKRKNEVD